MLLLNLIIKITTISSSTVIIVYYVYIGTHDIQDISSNVTHLTVSFVQNSQAQGALIIFISDGTCSYNYTVANKTGDSILISQQINNSTDSVFAFDIEANGLLKNVTSLRPAVRLDHDRQPCITTCDSEPSCNYDHS